ncbi:phosphoribosylaminoimidazole carboxylase, chloroplastic-like [Nicotiana tomentosiformis]|uniref:phosphoribosylaminoimidazole carboxylase, chloroplastic-like n=1 Tax=Nicotiana tomentosiformis TaxID=4098 RepID=UPI00388C8FA3
MVEIEHVDVGTLEKIERQGVDCEPKASTIRIIQDYQSLFGSIIVFCKSIKIFRRSTFLNMQLHFLDYAGDLFGCPLMIKNRRLAYDGRGNAVANSEEELSSAIYGDTSIIM